MPEITDPAMMLVQLFAGAFLLGVFFTIGAVAGLKLGTRWFGPITKSITINGPVPVVIRERE